MYAIVQFQFLHYRKKKKMSFQKRLDLKLSKFTDSKFLKGFPNVNPF